MQVAQHRGTTASLPGLVVFLTFLLYLYASLLRVDTAIFGAGELGNRHHMLSQQIAVQRNATAPSRRRSRAAPGHSASRLSSNATVVEQDRKRALDKGTELYELMGDSIASQSHWTLDEQLEQRGWEKIIPRRTEFPKAMDVAVGVERFGVVVESVHDQFVEPTRAYYRALYWTLTGVIVSQDSTSPKVAIGAESKRLYRGGTVSSLGHQSDILALEYAHLVKDVEGKSSYFRYFFRSHVGNTTTYNVLCRALEGGYHSGPPKWPGREFDLGTPVGKAVLWTANGRGVVSMLATRRAESGLKTVRTIRVFDDGNTDEQRKEYQRHNRPSLMFEVMDRVPPQAHDTQAMAPEAGGSKAHRARL
ncbi:Mitochondrial import inner membrane translocase subunit tim8 [Recurvomyces mirabilis]|nr:Mitochondrial import inner membrane translocase subunit tim8 [Recurvomyces mirabilis]